VRRLGVAAGATDFRLRSCNGLFVWQVFSGWLML